ncbi:G protein pathway suppressor 2-like isoform X2 [Myxocyprinus asiaticus]|uniref:G protein pathway suppressor 2-like isoform X2 n=1 Tax=Myxocyprinus asiaticus TaxID=70543 RepID=UPI0022224CA3|nr:G protein pathway suppressor 2-like isoform X2 [Myxocyprinus asiaticus]
MPAILERPKLSNAMARALHKHIMMERERKKQEEEEVDKMMEQKMKEEEERKRTKEMEERMSLEETKEQVQKMGGKLQVLQEEKHQLFLQLKKVLHEEEKRRRKEQNDITTLPSSSYQSSLPLHSGHLLSIQGSPVSHSRAGALLGDRSKQLFQTPLISGHHFSRQPGFPPGPSEHGQFSGSSAVHEPYAVTQGQHHSSYGPTVTVPISFAGTTQIRGASPFQSMPFLSHQPQGYAVQSHFSSQPGFIPSASISLQKQLEHANQQSGFTDSALHVSAAGLLPNPSMAVQISSAKSSPQPASRHTFLTHAQAGQRFYHHGKPH